MLIEAKNISKSYVKRRAFSQGNKTDVLSGVDFSLEKNATHALVGESGSGKTTLAKILLGLETADGGSLLFEEKSVPDMNVKALKTMRKKMQAVFQDPYSSLNPRMTVFDILTEPFVIHGLCKTKKEKREKAVNLLKSVGLGADSLGRYPHEFSGGQRQRICIARALALKPQVIVADEPVSALDVSVQAQILNLLKDLKDEYNLSYVFISHDFAAVRFLADTVSVMYKGEIVESAQGSAIFEHPCHPYTRELLAAAASFGVKTFSAAQEAASYGGCGFFARCPVSKEKCKTEKPAMVFVAPGHGCKCFAAEISGNKK